MSNVYESLDYLENLSWFHEKRALIKEHIKIIRKSLSNDEEEKVEISKNFIPLQTTPFEMFNTHICPRCKQRSVFNFNGERNNFCGYCGKKLNWRK